MLPSTARTQSSRTFLVSLVFVLSAGGLQPAQAQGTRLLRDPDVGPNHIVFAHANDLWLVDRDGGDAMRLTPAESAAV